MEKKHIDNIRHPKKLFLELFGGFEKTLYFCAQKVEKKNILIIYATRRTAERSDAATCKNKAQAEGFGGEKLYSLRGGGVRSQKGSGGGGKAPTS